jgi:hypothetical protein
MTEPMQTEPAQGEPRQGRPAPGDPVRDGPVRDEPSGLGTGAGDSERRSGLRNPGAAVRGVGAGALVLEAVVLLLAVVPLIKLAGQHVGLAVGAVLVLAAACVALAGLLRRAWAWYAGLALQAVLAVGGVLHLALLVLGLLFGSVWAYVLSVRRSVLGGE